MYGSPTINKIQGEFRGIRNPYDLEAGNIDYQAGRTVPSYKAKQVGQGGYVRSGNDKAT